MPKISFLSNNDLLVTIYQQFTIWSIQASARKSSMCLNSYFHLSREQTISKTFTLEIAKYTSFVSFNYGKIGNTPIMINVLRKL